MNRRLLLVAVLAMVGAGCAGPSVAVESAAVLAAESAPTRKEPPGSQPSRLVVGLMPGTDPEEVAAHIGAEVRHVVPQLRAVVLDAPLSSDAAADGQGALSALRSLPGVSYADEAVLLRSHGVVSAREAPLRSQPPDQVGRRGGRVSDDPLGPDQWHLDTIRARDAWDIGLGHGVRIAVVDSGADCSHPDLAPVCEAGYDFVHDDDDPDDIDGHGTHVGSIATAATDNGLGIAGVAWGARLIPAKALEGEYGWDSDIARAIVWSADRGAHVINLSLGSTTYSRVLAEAVSYAADRGVVIVASSGNDGVRQMQYPAGLPGVIGVGATTRADGWAVFSTFGEIVDLSAPGVGVLAAIPGGYGHASGTSMAAPVVSGVAGLILALRPGLSAAAVQNILESTAVDLGAAGRDEYFGAGRVDAGRALASLAPPSPTATASPAPSATASATLTATRPSVITATPEATIRPDPSWEAPTEARPSVTDEAPAPAPPVRSAPTATTEPDAGATPTRPPDAGFEPPTPGP